MIIDGREFRLELSKGYAHEHPFSAYLHELVDGTERTVAEGNGRTLKSALVKACEALCSYLEKEND